MFRSLLPVVSLAVCFLLPASALELSDLRLPLTRDEADKELSKNYSYRVLEDMTVRRSWELAHCTVSVDFSPKDGDKALLIFVDYTRPVSAEVAARDAGLLMGVEPGKWTPLVPKRAARLGMEAAEGLKLSGERYCFRELDESGRVVRLAYYDGVPKNVRWDLGDDTRESGKTAMGSRSGGGKTDFLWQDEERRRGVSGALTSAAGSSAKSTSTRKVKMVERPEEAKDVVAIIKEYAAKLTPVHYAIGGGIVSLLLLLRIIARVREARRRALVTEYIMKRGKINTRGRQ